MATGKKDTESKSKAKPKAKKSGVQTEAEVDDANAVLDEEQIEEEDMAKIKADEVEVEEMDEDESEEEGYKFSPYIFHGDQNWSLQDLFEDADTADEEASPVVVYDPENERWYKLVSVDVGIIPKALSS